MSHVAQPDEQGLLATIEKIDERRRRRALIFTAVPLVAAVLLVLTATMVIKRLQEEQARTAAQLRTFDRTRQRLEVEIQTLEQRKREVEAALTDAVATFGRAGDARPAASIRPRVRATELKGIRDAQGRQVYYFTLWLDVPESLKRQIRRVTYSFDKTFINKTQESEEGSNGFAVSYRGSVCLPVVPIQVVLNTGSSQEIAFEMCKAWTRPAA